MMDDDLHALAAEYALGTLDGRERRRAEALLQRDAGFAAAVRDWEQRLGGLAEAIAPVQPPSQLLGLIKQQLGDQRPGAQVIALDALRAKLNRWRGFGTAMAAVAAVLAAVLVTSLIRPDVLPATLRPKPRVVEITRIIEKPADNPSQLVAVLQKDAASPAFILTVDVASRTMTVRRVAAEEQPGKSYELWLVSKQFAQPRSLGLVGAREFTTGKTLAAYPPDTLSDATFAISLEPEGGSPTGEPTGPVLWGGKLIDVAPSAPQGR
ncbi:MAG: anti-sigma factor [Xanthobacteraceae bacterium]|nr:anti-sigma factor [Xanthobacteraceae bacterium]